MPAAPAEFDVFLSHHSGDKPWVIFLKSALAARGVRVWLDRDEIRPGDLFIDALEQGIQRSQAVALIVSPESMTSAWVREEYQRALVLANSTAGLRLIPCVLRNASLPGFMANRHWVDFRDPKAFEEKVDELCWGITGSRPEDHATQGTAVAMPGAAVTDAEIAYLDESIIRMRKERRSIIILRACAPVCGLGASALAGLPTPVYYLGSALVTGLLGIGLTNKKWSQFGNELKRRVAHRDALEMCRQNSGPVCPDVVDAFNRFIKRSIGIGVLEGDGA
jgi:hypothetical protein